MSGIECDSTLAIHGGEPVTMELFPNLLHGTAEIGDPEIAAVTEVLRRRQIFRYLDPETSKCAELERHFAAMTGCEHALAVGGGTGALICGLAGLGIGPGDEVIVPGLTYIASASAVMILGGVPVIAEIDESFTIDPASIEANITEHTKAIMPVHMRGIPCDMDAIMAIAERHNLLVIEDCAQACGGSYRGRRLGSMGHVGCFSMQHSKMITAGEGGMVVTNDRTIYERAAIRHDSAMCFWDPENTNVTAAPGENFRMNEMEGALGCAQFDRLEGILTHTRAAYRRIHAGIADVPGIQVHRSPDPEGDCGISAVFLTETGDAAKAFAEALHAEGVPAATIYDSGVPDRHIYRHWEYVMMLKPEEANGRSYSPDMCPRTLDILERAVLIPITQRFEEKHCDWVVEAIQKVAAATSE
jgi:8-amino-3,8-dideoxy-alpha-D-manno-octulosonate transaminase